MKYFAILLIALMPFTAGSAEFMVIMGERSQEPTADYQLKRGSIKHVKPNGGPWGAYEDPIGHGLISGKPPQSCFDRECTHLTRKVNPTKYPYVIIRMPDLPYEKAMEYKYTDLLEDWVDTLSARLAKGERLDITGTKDSVLNEMLTIGTKKDLDSVKVSP